jgi:hypothetical protein
MGSERLREELVASFQNRAAIYRLLLEELTAEIGAERAHEAMRRAIYRRGQEVGRRFARFAPSDLQGLRDAFLAGIPDEGRLFAPEVLRCDPDELEIRFHRCPLKEFWQEQGLPPEEVALLCDIAATVDYGTFEGAGFRFHAETWKPGEPGCCRLHVRPGAPASG